MPELYQAKAEFFRTLGHPARIRVLELLSERDHAVHELLGGSRSNRATCPSSLRCCGAPAWWPAPEGGEVVYSSACRRSGPAAGGPPAARGSHRPSRTRWPRSSTRGGNSGEPAGPRPADPPHRPGRRAGAAGARTPLPAAPALAAASRCGTSTPARATAARSRSARRSARSTTPSGTARAWSPRRGTPTSCWSPAWSPATWPSRCAAPWRRPPSHGWSSRSGDCARDVRRFLPAATASPVPWPTS